MEENKKSGLNKDLSSIFSGLEDVDNGRTDQKKEKEGEKAPPLSSRSGESEPPRPAVKTVRPPTDTAEDLAAGEVFADGDFPRRRKAILGLDVGQKTIKLVQLYPVSDGWEIGGYAVQEYGLPPESESLARTSFFGRKLKAFISEHSSRSGEVACALRGSKVNTGLISLAPMPKGELESACRLEASRRVSIDINKAFVKSEPVAEGQEKASGKLNYIVTVAARSAVSAMLGALRQAGLQTAALLPIPFAWKEFIRELFPSDSKATTAVVDIGSNRSLVSVYKGDKLKFNRGFETGGNQVTESIIQAGKTFGVSEGISWSEAERIKSRYNLFKSNGALTLKGVLTVSQVLSMVRPVLEKIAGESKRSLEYFSQLYAGVQVDRIYLAGGGALLPGLEDFFRGRLNRRVELFKLPENISVHESIRSREKLDKLFPRLSRAAALSCSRKWEMNFIPAKDKLIQSILRRKVLIIIPALALFALSFLFYLSKARMIPEWEKRIAAKNTILTAEEKQLEPYNDLEKLKNRLSARRKVGLYSSRREPDWRGILKELSRITPPSIVLTEVSLLVGKVPLRMLCMGKVDYSIASPRVTDFVVKVEKSPFFRDVEKISENVEEGKFSFSCTLVY